MLKKRLGVMTRLATLLEYANEHPQGNPFTRSGVASRMLTSHTDRGMPQWYMVMSALWLSHTVSIQLVCAHCMCRVCPPGSQQQCTSVHCNQYADLRSPYYCWIRVECSLPLSELRSPTPELLIHCHLSISRIINVFAITVYPH